MFDTIEEYLDALKKEMKGSDPALIKDALSDACEHLSLALEAAREKSPETADPAALKVIIDQYGTPMETASAYREIERRTPPSLSWPPKPETIWNASSVFTSIRVHGAPSYLRLSRSSQGSSISSG